MLIHYRQQPRECLLASACMVTGHNYDLVSSAFDARYGVKWGSLNAREAASDKWLPFLKDVLSLDIPLDMAYCKHVENVPKVIDWKKPALLIVMHLSGFHAIAFADGLVYDPGIVAPVAMQQYFSDGHCLLIGGINV